MAGFLAVPSGNADDDLTGAVLDTIATTPQTITGLTNGTAYVAMRVSDESAEFTPVAPDTTAPVLSSPTGAANGSDGATSLGVTTDEGNGTLYWGIYPTASTPSAADVVAGTGATVNGSQSVSSTGAQAVSNQTGLTASTAYKAHYVHDDAASNRSHLVETAEFTTAAGGSDIVNIDFTQSPVTGNGSALFISSLAANADDANIVYENTKDWDAINAGYSGAGTGSVRLDKLGNYPLSSVQIDGLDTATSYDIEIDYVIGASDNGDAAGDWDAQVRTKIGSVIGNNEYNPSSNNSTLDETQTGQPRLAQLRHTFTPSLGTTAYVQIVLESNTGGTSGGDIVITHFRLFETP